MKRRRVLASLTGAVSLAGCNIFRGPTTGSGRSEHDTPVAAANDHLQRVFDSLAEYQIVQDGTPAVDSSSYTPADLASLRQEQAAAAAAVDRLNELETTISAPRPASETVHGGVVLADHRLIIYTAGRRVAARDDAARQTVVESRYASISETATAAGEAARTTAAAASAVGEVTARYRESDRVTAPSFYRVEAAAREHEAYRAVGSRVGPTVEGVAAVGRALTNGVAGRRLHEAAAYADAEAAYGRCRNGREPAAGVGDRVRPRGGVDEEGGDGVGFAEESGERWEVSAEVGGWVVGERVDDDAPAGEHGETRRRVRIGPTSSERGAGSRSGSGRWRSHERRRLLSPPGSGRLRLSRPVPRRAGPPRRRR